MKPEEPNHKISSIEKKKSGFRWRRFFGKKWVFPAVYVVSVALILSVAWWYQDHQLKQEQKTMTERTHIDTVLPQEDLPTNPTDDDMILPVDTQSQALRTMEFYDEASPQKNKEASLVKYANTYWPHSGIDLARKDGKTFQVVSVLDGKVVRVEENPIVGYQVEVQHESGIITVYQSLEAVKVQKGQQVKKGDVIAKAGRNHFEKEVGIHLHFEVRNKENQVINPEQYLK